jgi:hypothetical protein
MNTGRNTLVTFLALARCKMTRHNHPLPGSLSKGIGAVNDEFFAPGRALPKSIARALTAKPSFALDEAGAARRAGEWR